MRSSIILVIAIFLISFTSAYTLVVRPLNETGSEQPLKSFNYVFNFTTDYSCSNVLLSHSQNITTSAYGVAVISIDTSSISQVPSFLCEYRNSSLRKIHNVSDQFFNDLYAKSVSFNSLTIEGESIFNGLTKMQNLNPIEDNLYSLGNSSKWFSNLYAKNIYSDSINTTNLNATDINTGSLSSDEISSSTVNTTNMTIGGHTIYKDEEGALNINL